MQFIWCSRVHLFFYYSLDIENLYSVFLFTENNPNLYFLKLPFCQNPLNYLSNMIHTKMVPGIHELNFVVAIHVNIWLWNFVTVLLLLQFLSHPKQMIFEKCNCNLADFYSFWFFKTSFHFSKISRCIVNVNFIFDLRCWEKE